MEQAITCTQHTKDISWRLWQEISPFVREAAQYAHHEFSVLDVWNALRRGDQQAWIVREGEKIKFVWITEILQQSGRKVVIIMAASGEMKYCWEFWPWFSRWMVGNAIDDMEAYCRPSMARLLRKHGLKTLYEVLTIKPMRPDNVQ